MKAFIRQLDIEADVQTVRGYYGEPIGRTVPELGYRVTLEMQCDAEAAEAFQRWVAEQYGHRSEPEPEQATMLLADGREYPIKLGGGK